VAVPERPLLAPWYRLVEDGDRLLLEHARSVVVLEGAAVRTLLPELLPLLDGSRTRAELGDALGSAVRPAVDQALELLAGHALLVEGGEARAPAVALAAAYGLAPAEAEERLARARVAVVGESGTGADVARLLRRSGVGSVERRDWERTWDGDLAVVAPGAEEIPRLVDWNTVALELGMRWLPVRPFDGALAAVGPLVVPGESPCHDCVVVRMAALVPYGRDFAAIERTPVAVDPMPPFESLLAAVAAQIALGWVGGHDTRLPGVVHLVEAGPPLVLSTHTVLKVPRCPSCSRAERLAPPNPWHEAAAA
jgi:bacteriocin biosynthesis cyclodehydratase domain-containing protein